MASSLWSKSRWAGNNRSIRFERSDVEKHITHIARPVYFIKCNDKIGISNRGSILDNSSNCESDSLPLIAMAPPLLPESFGDASFKRDLGLRYAYIMGAMANGITSVKMLHAAGYAGMISFFGSGGLNINEIDSAIQEVQYKNNSGNFPYGFNLIHSPNDPGHESATVDLYIQRRVRLISASAYLGLTPFLVYYRIKGIHQTPDGGIVCPNHIIAKVSRVEVARKFFAPPPQQLIAQLVHAGKITEYEANLAQHIPMAQDMTAEADSGGHTDNRPALTLLPAFFALRDQSMKQYNFDRPLRVGLAGGISTPLSTAAAFAMGAAYVLTGSINQACQEADTSQTVKDLLCQAEQADVTMAPAADMFELGAKVQVLKRGTMFAMRGTRLYEAYKTHDRYELIPSQIRDNIERDILKSSFEQAWQKTRQFFETKDPSQIDHAERDPKHRMALVFRSYLGLSSRWAKKGDVDRKMDYQVWCGPAMGAFNAWVKGSFLERVEERNVVLLAMNLLYGAAVITRCNWLRGQGADLPPITLGPLTIEEIEKRVRNSD